VPGSGVGVDVGAASKRGGVFSRKLLLQPRPVCVLDVEHAALLGQLRSSRPFDRAQGARASAEASLLDAPPVTGSDGSVPFGWASQVAGAAGRSAAAGTPFGQ